MFVPSYYVPTALFSYNLPTKPNPPSPPTQTGSTPHSLPPPPSHDGPSRKIARAYIDWLLFPRNFKQSNIWSLRSCSSAKKKWIQSEKNKKKLLWSTYISLQLCELKRPYPPLNSLPPILPFTPQKVQKRWIIFICQLPQTVAPRRCNMQICLIWTLAVTLKDQVIQVLLLLWFVILWLNLSTSYDTGAWILT